MFRKLLSQHLIVRYLQVGVISVVANFLFFVSARTMLDEQLGFPAHLIEHQLAHAVKDANGRAYNRTSFLEERKKMMQRWANYLDQLTIGGKVLTFKSAA